MKTIIAPVILGTVILVTGCAKNAHDNDDGHHNAVKSHHADMDHSHMSPVKTGHEDESGQHEAMMGDHHAKISQGDGHGMGHGESLAGKPGDEREVDRSIQVETSDNMRFSHEPFNIKDGETIKFIVSNKGAISHEFSIGTKDEHVSHGKMMVANPNMHHGPGGASITIKPGETETLIWSFEKAGEVEAACNIPGHYQAGMYSPVMFVK